MNLSLLAAGAAAVCILVAIALWLRSRRRKARQPVREALDTVAAWPPSPARVLSVHERQAHDLLRGALPGFMVLAQVPLARFLRVPTRHSYATWMQRVGALSADLLLCDASSRVLAVVDIRSGDENERSRRRHERMARVLEAAGIAVHVWREGALPTPAAVRASVGARLAPAPAPSARKADVAGLLAKGDQAYDAAIEPVPSAFFDEAESVRGPLAKA